MFHEKYFSIRKLYTNIELGVVVQRLRCNRFKNEDQVFHNCVQIKSVLRLYSNLVSFGIFMMWCSGLSVFLLNAKKNVCLYYQFNVKSAMCMFFKFVARYSHLGNPKTVRKPRHHTVGHFFQEIFVHTV